MQRARAQGALALELRAAVAWARAGLDPGLAQLRELRSRFREGSTRDDLLEADTLLG